MTRITKESVVTVKNRYLYYDGSDERFFMKGIAFPNAPPLDLPLPVDESSSSTKPAKANRIPNYNATAWIAVLQQLRDALPVEALNTVRLYDLDPLVVDYSEFFDAAARLGFYVLVPLTSISGDAILNRAKEAPTCYTAKLWRYGRAALQEYLQFPNVLAGVVGNEVMNALESWHAAPCIKAYTHDLKTYMQSLQLEIQTNQTLQAKYHRRLLAIGDSSGTRLLQTIPLLYAAQDSGIGAALSEVDTVRLSLDYLTCTDIGDNDNQNNNNERYLGAIDILGVNVESWCATYNTFEFNDDGITPGTFYQLWQGLHENVRTPLVMSELGCSHAEFNLDTPSLRTPEGTRDWTEVPVVLQQMQDTWSGYCAYAYWGNSLFNMMQGGPWNGITVLEPARDFDNFQQQSLLSAINATQTALHNANTNANRMTRGTLHPLPMMNGGIMEDYYEKMDTAVDPPTCAEVEQVLQLTSPLQLYSLQDMPSYVNMNDRDMEDDDDDDDLVSKITGPRAAGSTATTTTGTTIASPLSETWRHWLEATMLILGMGIVLLLMYVVRRRRQKRLSYTSIE